MKKIIALLTCFVMLLSFAGCGAAKTSSSSEGAKKFIMGIDPEYPPFSYMADDGSYTGFDVEV